MEELRKYSEDEISEDIKEKWISHFGESAIGIYWEEDRRGWSLREFICAAQCLGGVAIAAICLRLSQNYKYWSGGLPDLFLCCVPSFFYSARI